MNQLGFATESVASHCRPRGLALINRVIPA